MTWGSFMKLISEAIVMMVMMAMMKIALIVRLMLMMDMMVIPKAMGPISEDMELIYEA